MDRKVSRLPRRLNYLVLLICRSINLPRPINILERVLLFFMIKGMLIFKNKFKLNCYYYQVNPSISLIKTDYLFNKNVLILTNLCLYKKIKYI